MQSYNTLVVNLKGIFLYFLTTSTAGNIAFFEGAIVAVAWCLSPTHRWALLHGTFSPGGALDRMEETTNLAQLVEFTGISGSINSFCITLGLFFHDSSGKYVFFDRNP